MIAGARRIVAGGAGPVEVFRRSDQRIVVYARHFGDVDNGLIEHLFSARDCRARLVDRTVPSQRAPCVVEMKDIRPEGCSNRIAAGEGIVDPEEEAGQVLRKCFWAAPRAGGIEVPCVVVDELGRENAGTGRRLRALRGLRRYSPMLLVLEIAALERHHLLQLRGGGLRGRL